MHYHYIGDGLSSSEANFRAALDIAKEHQDKLWIAGMADIHKYQTERNSARLSLVKSDAASITFQLDCATDAMLYDQLLTLEVTLPASRDAEKKTVIRTEAGTSIATQSAGAGLLRFEMHPNAVLVPSSSRPKSLSWSLRGVLLMLGTWLVQR
jgi:hypothetical protein